MSASPILRRAHTGLRGNDRTIIGLCALGFTDLEISEYLGATRPSVFGTVRRLREYTHTANRQHLVAWAIDNHEIPPLELDAPLRLVGRDREVLEGLRAGKTQGQIGKDLGRGRASAKIRIERLMGRNEALDAPNLVALYCSQEFYDDAYFRDRKVRGPERYERYGHNRRGDVPPPRVDD